jgi:hypothetical protein
MKKEAPIYDAIAAIAGWLPPGLQAHALKLAVGVQLEVEQLRDRCDMLQGEVNALENPPHQLCGHRPEDCRC